jgi:hypothetical protein
MTIHDRAAFAHVVDVQRSIAIYRLLGLEAHG